MPWASPNARKCSYSVAGSLVRIFSALGKSVNPNGEQSIRVSFLRSVARPVAWYGALERTKQMRHPAGGLGQRQPSVWVAELAYRGGRRGGVHPWRLVAFWPVISTAFIAYPRAEVNCGRCLWCPPHKAGLVSLSAAPRGAR